MKEIVQGVPSARVLYLGWVDHNLVVPPFCPTALPLLPHSHQPKQSWVDSGISTRRIEETVDHSKSKSTQLRCTSRWDAL